MIPPRVPSAVALRLVALLSVLLARLLGAQTTAHTLSGTVTDPQGLAVQGSAVQVLAPNRVLVAEAETDAMGEFRFFEIPEGRYELSVEATGFSSFGQIIRVPLDSALPLSISLTLGPLDAEITVTARHGIPEETLFETASIHVRGQDRLIEREVSHLPRMLAEQASVWTQETTPGQGSPVLRGQGAQSVLYLMDGIRFNNSTYRSGNTQFLGWVPINAVDAVEVYLGPAGTQYGSDALGGAVNVASNVLPAWRTDGWRWGGETRTFFKSADLGAGSSVQIDGAGRGVAISLGGSYARYQELRAGRGHDSHNSLTRFLGFTSDQVQSALGSRLRGTDYAQASGHAKLGLRLAHDKYLTLNWIQSDQYGIRRYDRLLGGEGRLRSDHQPQRLRFGYARFQKMGAGALSYLASTFSFNQQTDGETSQTNQTTVLRNERSMVTALGYSLSFALAPSLGHSVGAGAEFYDEFISTSQTETPPAGSTTQVRPRFPNGTRYRSLGLYLRDDWDAVANRVLVEGGLRFGSFRFRTHSNENVFFDGVPTVPDATGTFTDLTFDGGLAYSINESLVLFGRVARAFRAPNVFDLGQLGITGGGLEVSPDEAVGLVALVGDSAASSAVSTGKTWQSLDAERLWSFEGGLRWKASRFSGDLSLFDSELFDSIQRRTLIVPTAVIGGTIGGQPIVAQDEVDRIFVELDPRPVVSRANVGRIRIYGLESSLRVNWADQWSSRFLVSFLRGRELDTKNYARRIAPDNLFAGLRWTSRKGRFWLEAFTEVAGPQTRLNPAELNDPRIGALRTADTIADFFNFSAHRLGLVENDRLTLTGEALDEVSARVLGDDSDSLALFTRTKGFATVNLRGVCQLGQRNELFFALTNITDANYRKHGSGFDAPGINLSLSYRIRFP